MQVTEIVLYKRKLQELKYFACVKSRKVVFLKFEFSIGQCLVYIFVSSRLGTLVRTRAIPVSVLDNKRFNSRSNEKLDID